MKITCQREALTAAFQNAAMVAPSRSPKAILKNVKLTVDNDSSTLVATDLEVGVRIELTGVEVGKPGTAVLPVDRFGSILRESSDEVLQIEANDQGATVRGERSEFKLPAENPEEFPEVVVFEETRYHDVPARLFRELSKRTIFATDTESSRYALGGVLLEFEENKITAVGTDGRRLAKMEGPAQSINGHLTGDTMTIVPTKSMQMIERVLSDNDAEIQIAARANDVLIRSPATTIYSRLVEGRFPKWRDVFPHRQEAHQIDIAVGTMYTALRQAAVVAKEESRGIEFTFGNGTLVLSAVTADFGESRVEFPIPYEGEEITVKMDHRFVADFLKVLDLDKTFTIEIESGDAAALFTTDDGYGYVVMPLSRER